MVEQKKFAQQQPLASAQQAFPTKALNEALNAAVPNNSNVISATPFTKVSEEVSVIQLAPEPILSAQAVRVGAPVITSERIPIHQAHAQQAQFQTASTFSAPIKQQQQAAALPLKRQIPIQQTQQKAALPMQRQIPIQEKFSSAEKITPKLNIVETTKPTISEAVELVEREMGIEKQTFQLPTSEHKTEELSLKPLTESITESISSMRPIERAEEAASSIAETASNIASNVSEAAASASAKGVEVASNMASSVASTASYVYEESKEVATNIGTGIAQAASNAAYKTAEVASEAAHKGVELASEAAHKGAELAADVGAGIANVASKTAVVASEAAHMGVELASEAASKSVELASTGAELASEAAHKGADLAADVGVGVASVASRTAELASESGMLERGKEMVSAAAHMGVEAAEAVVHMGSQVVSAAAHMGSQLFSSAMEMMAPAVVDEAEVLREEIEELSLKAEKSVKLQWVYPQIFSPAIMQAVIDISPIDFEADIRGLELDIKALSREGLWWGRSEQVEVAFGIRRLRLVCVFDSRDWSLSALEDWFGVEWRDRVQGIEFVGVNRLGKL